MHRHLILLPLLVFFAALPDAVMAQDARTILQEMQQRERARWEGVNNYVIDQATMGHRTLLFYEKIHVEAADGHEHPAFRMVLPDEIARRQSAERGFPQFTPEDMRAFSRGASMTGDALGSELDRELASARLPPGMMPMASPNRFATLDPRVMMGNVAEFYDATADAMEAEDNRDKGAEARESVNDLAEFAAKARFAGMESVGEKSAYVLQADVNRTEVTPEGWHFTIRTATYWIDSDEYVPLRMKMEGTVEQHKDTRELIIEKLDQNYQHAGSLYMPYRQVMRIVGAMDVKQKAEMVEAQQKLAEFEIQMQQMPASQREMAMNMMGPQIEMMKKMASDGGIEVVTDIYSVRVNAGLPEEMQMGSVLFHAEEPAADPASSPDAAGYSSPGDESPPSMSAYEGSGAHASGASQHAVLREAQERCLQEKIDRAQETQKKKRGLGRLMGAVTRTAGRFGNRVLGRTVTDIYDASATAEDLSAAAKDLGLTDDEVAACQNP
jgi:hypothetical protein